MFPKGRNVPRREFVRLLQFAYSGELGAAIAYAGHATAVADPAERQRIRQIRRDELEHRTSLGRMLHELGAAPDRLLELRNRWLGSGIARFCHMGGWFLPMYGAGWLERRNILDYERAARLSVRCGQPRFADALLSMAEAEWEHERYFRLKTSSHPLAVIVRVWAAPPCKEEIRCSFDRFLQESSPALPLLRRRGAMAGAST